MHSITQVTVLIRVGRKRRAFYKSCLRTRTNVRTFAPAQFGGGATASVWVGRYSASKCTGTDCKKGIAVHLQMSEDNLDLRTTSTLSSMELSKTKASVR
jgi:hypothetical protein